MTARSLAALAEASAPYDIISFELVLKPLLKDIRSKQGEVLNALLEALGFLVPLIDALHASYYTKQAIVLKVVKQYHA